MNNQPVLSSVATITQVGCFIHTSYEFIAASVEKKRPPQRYVTRASAREYVGFSKC